MEGYEGHDGRAAGALFADFSITNDRRRPPRRRTGNARGGTLFGTGRRRGSRRPRGIHGEASAPGWGAGAIESATDARGRVPPESAAHSPGRKGEKRVASYELLVASKCQERDSSCLSFSSN